jgi:hypothetical protein
MKTVKLVKGERFQSIGVLMQVMLNPDPKQGCGFAEMKRRLKVIDILEKLPEDAETVEFEDADYEYLRSIYTVFPFVAPHKDFVLIGEALGVT